MRRKIFKSISKITGIFLLVVFIGLNQFDKSGAWFTSSLTGENNKVKTKEDWVAPYVKIESPGDGEVVSGTVDIYGTITDDNPHHYWLAVQTLSGSTIAGPGVVNESNSLTNAFLYSWDTTGIADGDYVIKLEARDAFGQKNPDLAPVPDDPEKPNDSVDWITITVTNPPSVPVLEWPINNEVTSDNTPLMQWSDSTDNDGIKGYYYRVYIGSPTGPVWPNETGLFIVNSEYQAGTTADGDYYWQVRAEDNNGNLSDWTELEHVTIDTTPPITTLTVNDGKVVDEKIENPSLETGGSIANWAERGTVEQIGAGEEFEVNPYDGDYMARIGDTGDPDDFGNEVWLNGLGQSIAPGAKNLSFWYNFYTYDDAPFDEPGFSMVINGREIFNLYAADVWNYYSTTYPRYTGWQNMCIDLTQFGNTSLGISFYAGNTLSNDLQSWVYLDKVTTTEVVANGATEFSLETIDNLDGNPEIWYQVDEETPQLYSGPFTLNIFDSGEHIVYYWAVDEVGNKETPNSIKVHLDKEEPEAISDLDFVSTSTFSAELLWSAPADILGTDRVRAASYDIRYWEKGTEECDASAWETANKVKNPPVPRFPDEEQYFEVTGLEPDTAYCFAIKTCDSALNCSDISNVVSATTLNEEVVVEVNPGDVVINELMWMGSSNSVDDEWIELRNMTDKEIDLSGWQITKKLTTSGDEALMFTIPNNTIIKADGYLLISEYDKEHSEINVDPDIVVGDGSTDDPVFALANSGLQIKLYKGDWTNINNLIDTADDGIGVPMAGNSSNKWSMERNEDPGDGADPLNWHTCGDALTTVEYWDKDAFEQGTPGGKNRSDNELKIDFSLSRDKKSVGFKVFNIAAWETLDYEITYNSDQGPQGIIGEIEINGQNIINRDDFKLGTCSSQGKVCLYHTDIEKIKLVVVLKGKGVLDRTLEKEIFYE